MQKGLLILSLLTAVAAWHPTGHFIVARIAETELLKTNPALHTKLVGLLEVLRPFTKEKDHPFVECACFVDDIKAVGWKAFNSFHFYDYYLAGPGITPADLAKLPKSSVNMASSISDARETLRNTRSTQVDDRLGKSLMLRFLIHLIGDVHQPLHSTSRVTREHPRGDAGGNAFKLKKPSTDLHSYWDKTLGHFPDVRAPLEDRQWTKITTAVDDLMKRYPRDTFVEEFKKVNPSDWIKEGKSLVSKYAYEGIEEDGEVSEKYRETAKPVIERQLVLGGYRLTNYLIATFKDESLDAYFGVHQNKKATDDSDGEDNDARTKSDTSDDEDNKKSSDNSPKPTTPPKVDTGKAARAKPNLLNNKSKDKPKPKPAKLKPVLGPKSKKGKKNDGDKLWSPSDEETDESDFEEQREDGDEETTQDTPSEEPQGFFGRFFGAIGRFFSRLFGG